MPPQVFPLAKMSGVFRVLTVLLLLLPVAWCGLELLRPLLHAVGPQIGEQVLPGHFLIAR